MSGMCLTLGSTRDTEIGQDGNVGLSSPADVPEVAAGYWWHPSLATGLGGAGFKVPEGNGHSTFDLVSPTVVGQPTLLTENGAVQFRHRKTVDANPTKLGTASTVQAGWTGPTYVGMWARLPDAGGDITSGANGLFLHSLTTGNQRRFSLTASITTSDRWIATVDATGATPVVNRVLHWGNANWTWVEMIFDPGLTLGGSDFKSQTKIFYGLALQANVVDPLSAVASLFDANAAIDLCNGSHGTANVDTSDWAGAYYANGIPSLGNRTALSRWRAPI